MLQLCLLCLTNFFPSYLSIPGLSRFGMEYKEFATEMETLYDFQYFLMPVSPLKRFIITVRQTYSAFTCSNLTVKTLKQDVKNSTL